MKPTAAVSTPLKKTTFIIVRTMMVVFAFMVCSSLAKAQNYGTIANGNWTNASIWNNTSGWGATNPPTSGQGSGTLTISHNVTVTGDLAPASMNIASGKSLTVNGNFSISNGVTVNVSGTLYITGNVTLSANLNILPGGKVIVDGSVTVVNSTYLTVGTSAAPGQYADLIIKKNLISSNSGDVTINRNGRVAIFGNVTNDANGGTTLTINSGGQVYVDGNIALVGGGDKIVNNNPSTPNPYGLYVNGTTTVNTGQGSTVTTNKTDKPTLIATNDPFWQWVNGNTPLPIKLAVFKISKIDNDGIALTWTTATEINFDKFIIEHATNGVDFEPIGTQKSLANNTTTSTNYSFTHTTPVVGRNYYRLKSVDLDTQYEYSSVIYGEYKGTETIGLYPNPTAERYIILALNFAPSEGDKVQIFDIFGTSLQENLITNFENRIDFQNDLKPGTYLLKYTSTGGSRVLRFVVR